MMYSTSIVAGCFMLLGTLLPAGGREGKDIQLAFTPAACSNTTSDDYAIAASLQQEAFHEVIVTLEGVQEKIDACKQFLLSKDVDGFERVVIKEEQDELYEQMLLLKTRAYDMVKKYDLFFPDIEMLYLRPDELASVKTLIKTTQELLYELLQKLLYNPHNKRIKQEIKTLREDIRGLKACLAQYPVMDAPAVALPVTNNY